MPPRLQYRAEPLGGGRGGTRPRARPDGSPLKAKAPTINVRAFTDESGGAVSRLSAAVTPVARAGYPQLQPNR